MPEILRGLKEIPNRTREAGEQHKARGEGEAEALGGDERMIQARETGDSGHAAAHFVSLCAADMASLGSRPRLYACARIRGLDLELA